MVNKETRLNLFKAAKKVHDETGAGVFISEAPIDPKEKEDWADRMTRIQIAMWVDEGAACAHCGHIYSSVGDFFGRQVKGGYLPDTYVCRGCWDDYERGRE